MIQTDIRDIRLPNLIDSIDGYVLQQVGKYFMRFCRFAEVRLLGYGLKTHKPHQTPYLFGVNRMCACRLNKAVIRLMP